MKIASCPTFEAGAKKVAELWTDADSPTPIRLEGFAGVGKTGVAKLLVKLIGGEHVRRYGWRRYPEVLPYRPAQGEAIRYDHTSLGFDGLNDPLRSIIVWVLGPSIRRILKSRISNPT